MGSFTSTHSITYSSGSPSIQNGNFTITDGDADTTFEIGDTYFEPTNSLNYEYLGTMEVDGTIWPVFAFVEFPGFFAVFLDQEPVVVPPTLALNSAETFDRACFAEGTRITTVEGEINVEDLEIGTQVVKSDGTLTRVMWVGKQTTSTRFGSAARNDLIRLDQGALENGLPVRDLTLTADHALFIDGLLVNAGAMVNGYSITQVPLAELGDSHSVYHVETENHDVILAEGLPVETYIDYVGRQAFDNYQEYVSLYGDARSISENSTPRITTSRYLPATLRKRLGIKDAA
jgi:hypothetical protein